MPDIYSTSPSGELSAADAEKIGAAAAACKIVAMPTETAYILGTTGLIKAATRRLLQIKERSTLKPLVVLVDSLVSAERWAEFTPLATMLANKFWPGPVALVLRPTKEGRILTFPEYPTIAVRVPGHPAVRAAIKASGAPWVATSANKSGTPALAAGTAVREHFESKIDIFVDGGVMPDGEPTFIDATDVKPRVLKEGAVSAVKVFEAAAA